MSAAFDLMGDGWARGYPGDSLYMRSHFRTPHGIARACSLEDARIACLAYIELGCPPLESYSVFLKTINVSKIKAEQKRVAKAERVDEPLNIDLSSLDFDLDITP